MYEKEILIADLRFQIKLYKDRVDAFESGEKYRAMKKECDAVHSADMRTIRRLEIERDNARIETARVRDLWYATCVDIMKEKEKALKEKDGQIEKLQLQVKSLKEKKKEEHDKFVKKCGEVYEVKTQLEDEKEKNQALNARIKKDYSNSSKSSSMTPNHPTIHNSREKTGRKIGGQPGHIHHGRKRMTPTRTVEIPTPSKYKDILRYKATGKKIRKQLIGIRVITDVTEYVADEYRDLKTGQRVHAEFPPGIIDDVTYDSTVKGVAYLANNELCTSVEKTRKFMYEISEGKLNLSTGFINHLPEEFSNKTEKEREDIYLRLHSADILHADFTFGRAAGKQTAVIITTDGHNDLYQGREKKGDEGVKGSPLEHYEGTLISDHEAAIIKHGAKHQECLSHVLRYAKSGAENEAEKTWHTKLIAWIKESIGYWKEVNIGYIKYSKKEAQKYINELKDILELARSEYEYDPPTKYFNDGINTYKRMIEDFEDYVLFLREPQVPPTNNIAERSGRKYKRKSHQVMSFRSDKGSYYYCDGLTIIETIKANGGNLYKEVSDRFNIGLCNKL